MTRLRCAVPTAFSILFATLLSGTLFSGCDLGGTSTEAGNPGLIVGFRKDGQPFPFAGTARFYAEGSNPDFYSPSLVDGSDPGPITSPIITFGGFRINVLGFLRPSGNRPAHIQYIDGNYLADVADFRLSLPLLPAGVDDDAYPHGAVEGRVGLDSKRPFNIAFSWSDSISPDSTLSYSAFAQGIVVDSAGKKFRDANGDIVDTLWVDLKTPGSYTGTVDTTGLPDAPMVVYTPGSPYYARVYGNRFHLHNLPASKIPVRMVTRGGSVFSFPAPIDGAMPDSSGNDTLPMLVPGSRIGSLTLPAAIPVLDAPGATPVGPLNFTDSLVVTLTGPANTTLYYSLDGSMPGLHSLRYSKPIVLRASATLQAVAFRKGSYHSAISMHSYVLVPVAPKVTPPSQAFRDSLKVSIITSAKNGVILYTTDGSNPVAGSPVYGNAIVLKATTVLKAVTAVSGLGLSQITEERYILIPDTLAADTTKAL